MNCSLDRIGTYPETFEYKYTSDKLSTILIPYIDDTNRIDITVWIRKITEKVI